MALYKVKVGTLGMVHEGENRSVAFREYEKYLEQSKKGRGRVAGEGVFLYQDEEIIREYAGHYDYIFR